MPKNLGQTRRRHAATNASITHTTTHERWWTLDETWAWFVRWELVRRGFPQTYNVDLDSELWSEIDGRFLSEIREALLKGKLIAYGAYNNGPIQALHPWEWTRLDVSTESGSLVSAFGVVEKRSRPRKGAIRKEVVSHAILDGSQVLALWPLSLAAASISAPTKAAGRPANLRMKIQETLLALSTRGYNCVDGPGKYRRVDVARRLIQEWRSKGDQFSYKAPNVSQTLKLIWNGQRSFRAMKASKSRKK
ncbi:hypothetical protein QY049_13785 [Bradyrhizobium sp. WYCCWR 13022]|uniref:hypothetical protein n=1 Tax=unclassified Bradyrhizobium TaxID=2631580 RepID=UPI00263B5548|nr:hypothetical protein [Bradyrhizobium sp. WYCCWR 13022]MDN4984293.1 hypothetical protein [Bradyrhizobium sp. WYCCWR 13022]